jgi:FKBP-type peptidyl-prolyl cis-trans isomerase 2
LTIAFPSLHYSHSPIKEAIMAQAKQGNTVQVNYTGKLGDGKVFDTSYDRHPMQFTLGKGQLIAGFEKAVLGMNAGEIKTVVIPAEEAYGPHRAEQVVAMERKNLPAGVNPQVGQRLEITQADDQTVLVTVTDISETSVTIDANHPLAGKALTFDIELISIIG